MKKTHRDRKALLDRLEKKYIKKIQLHAFQHESDIVKNRLNAMRGMDIDHLKGQGLDIFDTSHHRPSYS